jgi:TolA-binding protein
MAEHQDQLALADFDHALKLNPQDQEAQALHDQAAGSNTPAVSPSQKQFDAGKTLWQSGDCAGAEAQLRDGLARNPYDPAANYYLADCLIKSGDYAGASLPLRLAVQYGANVPEGQLAEDEAKRLASQYSPKGGIAMGCAVPVPPPPVDGATAARKELLAAHDQLGAFTNASNRFQACLESGFTDLQNQVALQGRTYTGTALERKYQSQVDQNQQDEQAANAQYEAALAAYNAAHPAR